MARGGRRWCWEHGAGIRMFGQHPSIPRGWSAPRYPPFTSLFWGPTRSITAPSSDGVCGIACLWGDEEGLSSTADAGRKHSRCTARGGGTRSALGSLTLRCFLPQRCPARSARLTSSCSVSPGVVVDPRMSSVGKTRSPRFDSVPSDRYPYTMT